MGTFSRSFQALLWRNTIYRKRQWLSSIMEVLMPLCSIGILILIKNAGGRDIGTKRNTESTIFPGDNETIIPLSFTDYSVALQAKRVCDIDLENLRYKTPFGISGIRGDWSVPFVHCDARQCESLGQIASKFCEYRFLALAPKDKNTRRFKKWILSNHPALRNSDGKLPFTFDFIQIFDNEAQIEDYVKSPNYGTTPFPKLGGAIILTSGSPSYSYTLRVNSTNFNRPERAGRPGSATTPPTSKNFDTYAKSPEDVCVPLPVTAYLGKWQNYCTGQYMYNGAITLQRLVDDWIIYESDIENHDEYANNKKGTRVSESGVSFTSFARRDTSDDGFANIRELIPLFIILALMYPVSNIIRSIVLEKELRQKELMLMLSVSLTSIECAWFVSLCIFFFPVCLLAAAVSTHLFSYSDFFILSIFWLLIYLSSIVYSITISTIASKSTLATLIGLLVYFAGYILSIFIDYTTFNPVILSILSFHPVVALSYGLQTIGSLEDSKTGIIPETFSFSDNSSGYSFSTCVKSLCIDVIVWGILSLYLNRTVRGEYGQSHSWNFLFKKSFWFPNSATVPMTKVNAMKKDENKQPHVVVEPVSKATKEQKQQGKSIEIYNLTKKFGEKVAVDDLNLSIYNGQITALLGHNGAGKTTTISMLMGMIAPSEGYATVAGKDIRSDMSAIREGVGICLQHDCLFPLLTVKEHIQFFAQVKGDYEKMGEDEAEASVNSSMEDLALIDKRNTLAKKLSGGMKRKLSVAIAFCGNSEIVFLDEPTSGMDPFSRRFTWNVIRRYRPNRCIILTTHFMDEADLLGDRIAIMNEGRLRCVASSLFLKNFYGVGYQLTIEKNPYMKMNSNILENTPQPDAERILSTHSMDSILEDVVTGCVPESKTLSNVGTEIIFQIPLSSSAGLQNIFEELDKQVERKAIVTYGMSITTLDEVFLMVARGEIQRNPTENESTFFVHSSMDESTEGRNASKRLVELDDYDDYLEQNINRSKLSESVTLQGRENDSDKKEKDSSSLFARHVSALFIKRAKNFKRDKRAWFCTTLLPCLVTLVGFLVVKIYPQSRDSPPLTLSLEDFNTQVKRKEERILIPYSNAMTFDCNPGECLMDFSEFDITLTEEQYSFCGSSANIQKLGYEGKHICSVKKATDFVDEMTGSGVLPIKDRKSTSITEASFFLLNSSSSFEATQYGALYFNRDMNSIIVDKGISYDQSALEVCQNNRGDYRTISQCEQFVGISYVVFTNFTSLHAPLLYQAIADEAIINDAVDSNVSISATIHPLPLTSIEKSYTSAEDYLFAWFVLIFSFPLIMGSFGTFIVTERMSKAKHLQAVAGVYPSAYWLSSFSWDVINYQIPLWTVIALIYIIDIDVFTSTDRGAAAGTITALILFGPAAVGFTYCLTFLFTSPSTCNYVVICMNFFLGLAGPLSTYILRIIAARDANDFLSETAKVLDWCLRFAPSFCLGRALFFSINIDIFELFEGRRLSAWSPEIMYYDIIFLALESFLYVTFAICLDTSSSNLRYMKGWIKFKNFATFKWVLTNPRRSQRTRLSVLEETNADDDDVVSEEERVNSGNADSDQILIRRLNKCYNNGKVAVKKLTFGIPSGECFGLLGTNGAGKTTTMGMLTAEFPPTHGDAILAGYSLTSSPNEIRKRIGYCPQFDAHFSNLTGREHVELYASIKGIPYERVKGAAALKLSQVGLSDYDSDRLASTYSGGMKRKLSVACATIGDPQIVFLDEPSTGMDPLSRRHMWGVISDLVSKGNAVGKNTSVILTTHSMEECEALCPRIGIMTGGELRCLGSAQHLKSKFGKGYQVELKIAEVETDDEDYLEVVEHFKWCVDNANVILDYVDVDENNGAVLTDGVMRLEAAKKAVESLTNDDSLSSRISSHDPNGCLVHKNATSEAGVTVDELAAFCAGELRVRSAVEFFEESYPNNAVLRERQDKNIRVEIGSDGVKFSSLFRDVERSKSSLRLIYFGISQTTLEQVFNMHATEAEKAKQNQVD